MRMRLPNGRRSFTKRSRMGKWTVDLSLLVRLRVLTYGLSLGQCGAGCERAPTITRSIGTTLPGGHFLAGASPYGALDMAGNVWEWVGSLVSGIPVSRGRWTGKFERRRNACGARRLVHPSCAGNSVRVTAIAFFPPARIPYLGFGCRGVIDWVTIPAGDFVMGSDRRMFWTNRQCTVASALPEFQILGRPMTNAQYTCLSRKQNIHSGTLDKRCNIPPDSR